MLSDGPVRSEIDWHTSCSVHFTMNIIQRTTWLSSKSRTSLFIWYSKGIANRGFFLSLSKHHVAPHLQVATVISNVLHKPRKFKVIASCVGITSYEAVLIRIATLPDFHEGTNGYQLCNPFRGLHNFSARLFYHESERHLTLLDTFQIPNLTFHYGIRQQRSLIVKYVAIRGLV